MRSIRSYRGANAVPPGHAYVPRGPIACREPATAREGTFALSSGPVLCLLNPQVSWHREDGGEMATAQMTDKSEQKKSDQKQKALDTALTQMLGHG